MSMATEMAKLAQERRTNSVFAQIRTAADSGRKSCFIDTALMSDHVDYLLSKEGFEIERSTDRNGMLEGWNVSWE